MYIVTDYASALLGLLKSTVLVSLVLLVPLARLGTELPVRTSCVQWVSFGTAVPVCNMWRPVLSTPIGMESPASP